MLTPQNLVEVMEAEKGVLSRLLELTLREREAIVNYNTGLLTDCLREKEELKGSLEGLEEERIAAAKGKGLQDIMNHADQEVRGKLAVLQQELKVRARETRALGRANALLFKQSLALMAQLQEGICSSGAQAYNQTGQVEGSSLAGKLVSSSA